MLGPSGSGKTTLMRVLAGLERPCAGSLASRASTSSCVRAAASPLSRRRTLGYADQHYWRALAGELTAAELVGVPLGLAAGHAAGAARAHESCSSGSASSTGQTPSRASSPVASSSGSRSARRSRTGHGSLIADEPTGELDAASARRPSSSSSPSSSREEGATALIVSHDPRSAEIADRVVHIRDGRVSEERQRRVATAVVIGRGRLAADPRGDAPRGRVSSTAPDRVREGGVVELRPAR